MDITSFGNASTKETYSIEPTEEISKKKLQLLLT